MKAAKAAAKARSVSQRVRKNGANRDNAPRMILAEGEEEVHARVRSADRRRE